MANPSQRASSPDDDSWGKIASDLFGIQFNDDDFELPDDDAPAPKVPPVTPASPSPVASSPVEEELVPAAEADENDEPAKVKVPGNEDHDEFWDILESWNWDESAKSPPRRAEEPRGR